MNTNDKIYIAGHRGLAGSALVRALNQAGYTNLVYRSHAELDLTRQQAVEDFFAAEKPDYVFIAAAKVGGIHANSTYRGEFIYTNLAIELNIMEAARKYGVKRLLFLSSSCMYPRLCPQPMKEAYLLTSQPEPTNEPYAIAKIAGVKLCEAYNAQYGTDFISVVPNNLYGPNDNFDLENAHVLPAMIHRVHKAKAENAPSITLWGTGSPKREFLHSDDMASACLHLMKRTEFKGMMNIGSGEEVTIRELIELLCKTVNYQGELIFDSSKPDGAPRKLLDTTALERTGWQAKIQLKDGLRSTYDWFCTHQHHKEAVSL